MAVVQPESIAAVDAAIRARSCVLNFCAEWCEPCAHMNLVFSELAAEHAALSFLQIDADRFPELCERFELDAVPAFLFFHAGELADKLLGADAAALSLKAKSHGLTASLQSVGAPPSAAAPASGPAALEERLKALTHSAPVMVFMKGSPDAPRCGFSRMICEILAEEKVQFGHFDILSDAEVRQGLKTFSNWPTYPQLYANGKLVGGLDIVKELKEEGELLDSLPAVAHPLENRLKALTNSAPVMVFMKGSPVAPRCGFSRQICEILTELKVQFGHFDILSDADVRQGLKTYSNWPTYPQLYANGKLVGGLDIVKELKEEGELLDSLPAASVIVS